MPKFNALFAYVWNHAVTKIVNMSTYVSPVTGESYEALLARKLPKADGTPSDTYAISKQFMDLLKHWAPVFEYLYKKKRVTSERDLEAYTRQQVTPLLL